MKKSSYIFGNSSGPKRLASVLVSALWFSCAFGQSLPEDLDAYVAEQIKNQRIPALSIVITRKGSVVYEALRGAQTTPTTRFALGTTGQIFTALAVLQLVDSGKISLDEKIPGPSATYRQLLSHTSRLPEFLDVPGYEASWEATAESLLKLTEGRERPKGYSYSNTNYLLLNQAIARISGKSAQDVVQSSVFVPIGMRATSLVSTTSAAGFEDNGKAAVKASTLEFGDARWYGAGWETTPTDMRTLCLAWETQPILKRATWAAALQRVSGGDFGLGFEVGKLPNDRDFVGMEGGIGGYSSGFVSIPSLNLEIGILCNVGGISAYSLASDLSDFVIADDDVKNGGE